MKGAAIRSRSRGFTKLFSILATILLAASAAPGVPIDLTDAKPSILGATTLRINDISTMGASYWADFEWNQRTNKFDVKSYGEEPTQRLLLDNGYGVANAAYSLRKLRASHSGACIKVRRSSDEVEADVAFDADGLLSEASPITVTHGNYSGDMNLAALCAGTDGYVVTWYDQSQSDPYDAVQITSYHQPQIVSSGALIMDNARVSIQFDGIDDHLDVGNELFGDTGLGSDDMSIWTVASLNVTDYSGFTIIGEGTASRADYFLTYGDKVGVYFDSPLGRAEGRYYRVSTSGGSGLIVRDESTLVTSLEQMICGYTWGGFEHELWTNDNPINTSTAAPMPYATYADASIGACSGHALSENWKGTISEIVQWHSDQRDNSEAISMDLNEFYKSYE